MKIELKCGRDDCETVTTDKDECVFCLEIERIHYYATIERLEAELAKSRTYCDETFAELNERNILIVDLEVERDEAIKEVGKQALGRGCAEQERDEEKKNAERWHDEASNKTQKIGECYYQRDSARKTASDRYDVINEQTETILSMRNCGNCADSNSSGSKQVCIGCHGFDDVDREDKKTYLAKWKPGKQVVK